VSAKEKINLEKILDEILSHTGSPSGDEIKEIEKN